MPGATRPPGWHPDPDDSALIRYWSGRSWTHRRRVRPPWTVATAELQLDPDLPVVEGPAHVDALAAKVTPPVVTRPQRLSRLQPPSSTWDTRWDEPGALNLGRPPRLHSGRGAWARPRRPVVIVGAVLAVAFLVVASTTGLSERPPMRVVSRVFAAQANQICQSALAPSASPSGGGSNQGQLAIASVQPLVARLGALATRIDNKAAVKAWVGSWRQWVTDERSFLASTQSHPGAGNQNLAREADLDAEQADQFARENGLNSCLLTPQAATSTVNISQ